MDRCPTEEHLAIYTAGACDEHDARTIAAHLESCDRCRTIVGRERSNNDWLREVRRSTEDETVAATVEKSPERAAEPAKRLGIHPPWDC